MADDTQRLWRPLWRRLILVQGHRRSGSTWLAAVLGQAAEASLIPYEPLWLTQQPETIHREQIREFRRSGGWYLSYDPDQPLHQEHAGVIRDHLNLLVRHYFGGPVDTLVVKEPHPNWMPVLRAAYQPDYVLFLDRHPLGILNSYEKSGLYEGWETADEWQKFLADMRILNPDSLQHLERVRHPAERVVQMAYSARELCLKSMECIPHSVVDYEPLCLDPYAGFEQIFTMLGWQWDEDVRKRVKPLVDPEGENEPGFVAVRKRSYERAYAWRSEMAPHLVRSIIGFLEKIGWSIEDEEAGRPITFREGVSGAVQYVRRRIQWLRRFGPGAVIRGL